MIQKFFTLSFGFAAIVFLTLISQAYAQSPDLEPAQSQSSRPCAPHKTVVARLASGYGETRQSIGLAPNNTVIEVFASLETGTWTITVTAPSGQTCLVASGQAFEVTPNTPLAPAGRAL